MPRRTASTVWFLPSVIAVCLLASCSGDKDAAESGATTAEGPASAGATAQADIPNACTFFTRDELEKSVGWELNEGEPQTAPPPSSECSFESPPKMYVTRTFPDPPLPEATGFSSVTVNTHATSEKSFEEFRTLMSGRFEEVPGLGDRSYFYGFDMLYVRVGNRGFSIRMYTEASSDADKDRVKSVLKSLAQTGVARLG